MADWCDIYVRVFTPRAETPVIPDEPDVLDGGDVVELSARWDSAAEKRFFKRLLRNHGGETRGL